ncbi:MAG: hypothetical protein WDZ30_10525 [Cellvibrionaceae bacterium]
MKPQSTLLTMLVVSASLAAVPALAQDANTTTDDELDVSLTVLEEGEGAEQAINNIELPEQASEEARENAAFGLETANEARQKGQEKAAEGREKASEARANADGLASEAASQARERVKSDIAQGSLERVPSDVRENLPGAANRTGN